MILTAFLVGLTLTLVGLFVASIRGFALWREAKRTGGLFASELELFEERSARAEQLLGAAVDRVATVNWTGAGWTALGATTYESIS